MFSQYIEINGPFLKGSYHSLRKLLRRIDLKCSFFEWYYESHRTKKPNGILCQLSNCLSLGEKICVHLVSSEHCWQQFAVFFFCKRSIFLINIIYQIGFIFQLFVLVVCNHKKSAIRFGYSNEMGNDTIWLSISGK